MWMNILPHTWVGQKKKKKREGKRYGEWRRDTRWEEKKVGGIKMHEESSQISFPVPSLQRLLCSTDSLSGLVYCNRRPACEYPVLSCDVVSVEMCVRKRWFMMGVWQEWRVMSCYCRRCHKMFVSSPSNGSVYGLHPPSLGHSTEESSNLTQPGMHMHITDVRRHSLANRMLKRGSADCKWEESRGNNASVNWGHSADIKQAWVASPQITFSQQEREKRQECFLSNLFLNYLLFSEGDDGLCLRKKVKKKKKKTLSGLIV